MFTDICCHLTDMTFLGEIAIIIHLKSPENGIDSPAFFKSSLNLSVKFNWNIAIPNSRSFTDPRTISIIGLYRLLLWKENSSALVASTQSPLKSQVNGQGVPDSFLGGSLDRESRKYPCRKAYLHRENQENRDFPMLNVHLTSRWFSWENNLEPLIMVISDAALFGSISNRILTSIRAIEGSMRIYDSGNIIGIVFWRIWSADAGNGSWWLSIICRIISATCV